MPIPSVTTKQKLLTRTAVTIILLVLGVAGLVGASVYLATTYYTSNQFQANNQYSANNQMSAASIQLETSQSQYQIGDEVLLK